MSPRRLSLRARLTVSAVLAAAIALAALISAFNLLLDARLHADADNLLRERATTVLRGLGTVDGRLSVIEAPDLGAVDAQTWIFAGARPLEQPARGDARDQRAALTLARSAGGFTTVAATDTRLFAAPVRQATRRLGTVVVGASLTPYESSAASALLGSVILGVLMLAALVALSLWLISHALRPVAQMTSQAADWGEHDLSRRFFAGEPHDELSALASVLDGLLARLAQSLRREQRLTAEVSHELRTPLAKILAEAELAGGRERSSQEYRDSLQLIKSHSQELQRVLETLLASARAGATEGTRSSDARDAARHAATRVGELLDEEGKTIELVCTAPVRVAVEADMVERILSPLLENAARFARQRIVLDVRAADGEVLFDIRDDGPGVQEGDRERIFDPGFRSGAQRDQDHQGAGLGLALVRRLARAAGGEVEARTSGSGGSFVVRLPAG
ncbi:MAG TPA: HAMP domain-containing sensor histidine kinase [Solirubrobacteraceae bacterium]|jgi:signal transduction histidine kinase|nr:HAMP domain-containing sensor histidine kinase [Solirubrobacteraceae bacterium]